MAEVCRADFASRRDSQSIVHLLNEYAQDQMGGGKGLSAFARSNLVFELSKRPTCAAFIAYSQNEPSGLAICFEGFSTFQCKPILNIHDLVVIKKHRGMGISRALFEAVERFAVNSGCCKLTLEVLEGNSTAQKAYKSFGFAGYELDPDMGRALFLEKTLDA